MISLSIRQADCLQSFEAEVRLLYEVYEVL
jgi:hypothetical protein